MHTLAFTTADAVNLLYLLAAVLFIFGLKMLASVKTAPKGNLVSSLGMLIAAVVTLFLVNREAMGDENFLISFVWIGLAMAIGAILGVTMALKVPMTGMPQMVGLLNGFGGIASLLVACADYSEKFTTTAQSAIEHMTAGGVDAQTLSATGVAVQGSALQFAFWYSLLATGLATLIGGVTFTGSLVAFGKLQEVKWVPDNPVQFPGQKIIIAILLLGALALSGLLVAEPTSVWAVLVIVIAALVLGVLLVIGIGGADMPVVIALLNSYSGLAAAMAGFVLQNYALIITGSLVGASGLILTNLMCKAMNRSLVNVLFGGVGGATAGGGKGDKSRVREYTPEDLAILLTREARQVMIVPGYGMAVAQAQHAVKELADALEARGLTVKYAIHPVAGRMPGHMNVLLAEAGVSYDQLLDLEEANNEMEQTDAAIILGANDVTNPAARTQEDSPIYGMPIINVDEATNVFVIKRSLSPGFAGIDNELWYTENCGMVFGDGKKVVTDITAQVEDLSPVS